MMLKYMPRPQKKRGNNGRSYQHNRPDPQNSNSVSKGKVIAQRFLKSNIYNKKFRGFDVTMNLYPHKLNTIPSIIEEVINCVVVDGDDLKRICFETGYGKPKKSIDIRKCVSRVLTNKLGYNPSKSGTPKTFKFLSDFSNRIIVYPQSKLGYDKDQILIEEKNQAIIDAKLAKIEKKRKKLMKKHFVHNKWKKNRKYPQKIKKKKTIINNNPNDPNKNKYFTPGGDDNDNVIESDDNDDDDVNDKSDNDKECEETEDAYLSNLINLQVNIQNTNNNNNNNLSKRQRRRLKKLTKNDVNIFDGVQDNNHKFEYIDPDAYRYKKKAELIYNKDKNMNMNGLNDKNVDWKCEFCTFINYKKDDICQMCFTESFKLRAKQFFIQINKNNQINKSNINSNDGVVNAQNDNRFKWKCDICTFINTGDNEECDMCLNVSKKQEEYYDYINDDYHDKFFNVNQNDNDDDNDNDNDTDSDYDYADDYIIKPKAVDSDDGQNNIIVNTNVNNKVNDVNVKHNMVLS